MIINPDFLQSINVIKHKPFFKDYILSISHLINWKKSQVSYSSSFLDTIIEKNISFNLLFNSNSFLNDYPNIFSTLFFSKNFHLVNSLLSEQKKYLSKESSFYLSNSLKKSFQNFLKNYLHHSIYHNNLDHQSTLVNINYYFDNYLNSLSILQKNNNFSNTTQNNSLINLFFIINYSLNPNISISNIDKKFNTNYLQNIKTKNNLSNEQLFFSILENFTLHISQNTNTFDENLPIFKNIVSFISLNKDLTDKTISFFNKNFNKDKEYLNLFLIHFLSSYNNHISHLFSLSNQYSKSPYTFDTEFENLSFSSLKNNIIDLSNHFFKNDFYKSKINLFIKKLNQQKQTIDVSLLQSFSCYNDDFDDEHYNYKYRIYDLLSKNNQFQSEPENNNFLLNSNIKTFNSIINDNFYQLSLSSIHSELNFLPITISINDIDKKAFSFLFKNNKDILNFSSNIHSSLIIANSQLLEINNNAKKNQNTQQHYNSSIFNNELFTSLSNFIENNPLQLTSNDIANSSFSKNTNKSINEAQFEKSKLFLIHHLSKKNNNNVLDNNKNTFKI